MEDRLHWRIASDRVHEEVEEDNQENGTAKQQWRSLFSEERHKEHDPSLLEPRVDQWRMKERVRRFQHPLFLFTQIPSQNAARPHTVPARRELRHYFCSPSYRLLTLFCPDNLR